MARGYPMIVNNNQTHNSSIGEMGRPMNPVGNMFTSTFNNLAIPVPQSFDAVREGGQILFENFVRQEFLDQGLEHSSVLDRTNFDDGDSADFSVPQANGATSLHYTQSSALAHTPGYKTSDWQRIGRELREMADEIAKSRQGAEVREKAEGVELTKIDRDQFVGMLMELFKTGFTKERIVLLFYFCCSLIIRSARLNVSSLTRNIFAWSLSFILSKVCDWVYENGGWEKVLSKMYDVMKKMCFLGILIVGIGCGIVYIRKNW